MECPTSQDLQRYYDGELADAETVREHLAICPVCAEALQSFEAITQAVRSATMPVPTMNVTDRWIRAMRASQERSILRLASWLTAAAAVVLVAVSVWPTHQAQQAPRFTINEWETAMLARDEGDSASTPLATAKWIAADLSETEGAWH